MWVADRPITFEQFLDGFGEDDDVELVNGTVVERMSAQLEHERLVGWLYRVLGDYAEETGAGQVLGSRTAVEIWQFGARLPDLLFVSAARADIVQQRAVVGPPDLVIEIRSPSDRPSHLQELEADYRRIGVPEIWFVDMPRRRVRVLRSGDGEVRTEELLEGEIVCGALPGLRLRVDWLFDEPRPKVRRVVADLLGA